MMIPVFLDIQYVDMDGFLTPEIQIYQDQLNQALQDALSDNGWTTPQISAVDLALIAPDMPNGTFWYESDNHEVVFKINGALRKLVTAAYP